MGFIIVIDVLAPYVAERASKSRSLTTTSATISQFLTRKRIFFLKRKESVAKVFDREEMRRIEEMVGVVGTILK